MLRFIGFALLVQLLLAIGLAMVRDLAANNNRELAGALRLPSRLTLMLRTAAAKLLHWVAVDYRRRARTHAAERLQPFSDACPDRPTHLAVFVRGTFGAEGYDNRWEKVVAELRLVHPRTAFFCFYWPGRNSERSRRAEAAVLAEALEALHARHPGLSIIAIGHSHGGTLIEHASRVLPDCVPLAPLLLAAPILQYGQRVADASEAQFMALGFATAIVLPALLLHLAGWALWLLGFPALQLWNLTWFEGVGIVAVFAVFAIRPAVQRARKVLGTAPPAPRHAMRHIWCRGDEIFKMFAHSDAIRSASEALHEAWREQLSRLPSPACDRYRASGPKRSAGMATSY
jgi:hypothetical protein